MRNSAETQKETFKGDPDPVTWSWSNFHKSTRRRAVTECRTLWCDINNESTRESIITTSGAHDGAQKKKRNALIIRLSFFLLGGIKCYTVFDLQPQLCQANVLHMIKIS